MNKKFKYIIVCTLIPIFVIYYLNLKLPNKSKELDCSSIPSNTLTSFSVQPNNSLLKYSTNVNNSYSNDTFCSVKDFGAKGDYNDTTGTDDSEAIIKAINSLKNVTNATLFFPGNNGYLVKQPISIPPGINVKMDAPIIYLGNDNSTCLTIGEKSKANSNVKLTLNVKKHQTSNWSDENCIGIKIVNANQCDINIINSNGFTIGTQFIGDSKGLVYNTINLYSIANNKIGIDLTNNNDGWCNENLFLNGRFSCNTNVNPGQSRFGVRITSKTNYINNDNVFIKPSFEINQKCASPKEAIPILIEYGQTNKFMFIRSEGNSLIAARILNNSVENHIDVLYGMGHIIDDNSNYPTTIFYEARTGIYRQNRRIVYHIPNISQIATPYLGENYTHLQGLITKDYSKEKDYKAYEGIKYNNNYIQFTRPVGIGIYVDTTKVKEYIISGQSEYDTIEPSAFVVCYDKDNNIITTSNVTTTIYSNGQPQSYFGGCLLLSSSSTSKRYFKVSEKVKKIFVGYLGNSSLKVTLKSFMLETPNIDYSPPIILPINKELKRLAIEPPQIGTWEKGTVIYNDDTIELKKDEKKYYIQGWICTIGGSPGTWKEIICPIDN